MRARQEQAPQRCRVFETSSGSEISEARSQSNKRPASESSISVGSLSRSSTNFINEILFYEFVDQHAFDAVSVKARFVLFHSERHHDAVLQRKTPSSLLRMAQGNSQFSWHDVAHPLREPFKLKSDLDALFVLVLLEPSWLFGQ